MARDEFFLVPKSQHETFTDYDCYYCAKMPIAAVLLRIKSHVIFAFISNAILNFVVTILLGVCRRVVAVVELVCGDEIPCVVTILF